MPIGTDQQIQVISGSNTQQHHDMNSIGVVAPPLTVMNSKDEGAQQRPLPPPVSHLQVNQTEKNPPPGGPTSPEAAASGPAATDQDIPKPQVMDGEMPKNPT